MSARMPRSLHLPIVLLAAIALLFSGPVAAVPRDAKPVSFARSGAPALDGIAEWRSPEVDVSSLLAEDAAVAEHRDLGIPLRVGFRMDVDLSPDNSGTWEELESGDRLWRLSLQSEGALWLVVGFDAFRLQDGGVLWVYDANGKTILGPFTTADVRDHGELWTVPVEGDTLALELFWPKRLLGEEPRLHLGTVTHGYRPFGTIGREAWLERNGTEGIGDSGSCNIDVNCPFGADWQDEKRGVVILLNSGGSSFCSGSLINNTANDCKPYVLTAAHCGAGTSTAYGFNFERSGCGTGNPPPPTTQMVSGGTVRGNFSSTDFTLVEMNSLPPESFNFYFNGWSRDPNPSLNSWGIHHPSGDVKKISHDEQPPVNGINWGPNHWRIQNWEHGTTEPGSSGSPLFDQSGRITGQLHGGTASCSSITYDEYGKVAESWNGGGTNATRLSNWLDPLGTGAITHDGLNGSVCFFQPAGSVSLNRTKYACSDTVVISLRDDSLQGNATQDVTIESTTETIPETVVLTATAPGAGTFQGSIPTTSIPPATGDGALSVSHGDTITVRYIDADDGAGNTNVPRTATATADCRPPVITNVASSNVTGNSARITWTTDEASDSTVRYGTSIPPSSSTFVAPLVTAHTVDLTGLPECSLHYYSVRSADSVANASTDDAGGAYYTFETGKNVSPSYPSSGPPIPIPDNNPTGATSTIAVTDTKTVLEVKVRVNITHTYDGDLSLALIAPNGATVSLAERRGGSGDNFTNTVFDDAAATAISAGTAPFNGTFRPESPLSAATGIPANGNWQFRVIDKAGADVGTIDNWTLMLRFPAASCGPHATYRAHGLLTDACSAGGPGNNNGRWDAGETVDFSVTVENDGTDPLTGVTATLVPTTPGVTMVTATASYPDLLAGASAVSNAPHFRAILSPSLLCGGTVSFDVVVSSNQGSWTSTMGQGIGQVLPGGGTILSENFSSGIPATWTIVDGGSGGGAAATWTGSNPGGRTAAAPMANPLAIVDSDNAGTSATQDEQLITPLLNLSTATSVTLDFDQYFQWYSSGQNEKGDVDVRSSLTGGAWVNVLRNQGASSANPNHRTIDLTPQAAGASDVQIRFRYYDAQYEWYWQVDNVVVTYAAPGGCAMDTCLGGPPPPPPVPDGTFGTAVKGSKAVPDGSSIDLTWDVSSCTGSDYHVLYGPLSGVSTYTVTGASCDLGTTGSATWTAVPPGDLWWVIVSDDDASLEGSWGRDSFGGERNGSASSGLCSMTTRNNGGTCP